MTLSLLGSLISLSAFLSERVLAVELLPALLALSPKTIELISGLLKVLKVGQERKAVLRAVRLWVVCPGV